MDFLKEANHVIAADYRAVETEMESMREDQGRLNHQIDALINSFSMVDAIEAEVARTEANIDLIGKAVNRLSKPSHTQTSGSSSSRKARPRRSERRDWQFKLEGEGGRVIIGNGGAVIVSQ
jgi:hypothetical protein